jgi:hypothetical protein
MRVKLAAVGGLFIGSMVTMLLTAVLWGPVVAAQPQPPGPAPCQPGPLGELLGEFGQRLAMRLGASEEQARTATQQTMMEMQPQIEARFRQVCQAAGQPGGFPASPGQPGAPQLGAARPAAQPGGPPMPPELILGVTAQVLDMTPEAIMEELQQGSSLAQIALAHGVSPDELADQITAAAEQMRIEQLRARIRQLLEQPLMQPGGPRDR